MRASLAKALAALVLGIGGIGAATAEPPRAAPEQGAARPPGASGRPEEEPGIVASTGNIDRTILVNGELRASRARDLSVPNIRSGFASTVTFLAQEGTRVRQGERIIEFDASMLLSRKSEAERKLDEAKLKIEKTRADLEATRADLLSEVAQAEGNLKVAELYGKISKELVPANTHQKYQLDLEKATLALGKAKEQLTNHVASIPAQLALVDIERQQAEIDLKKIQGDLALLEVNAPQDGIVIYGDNWASNRKVQPGDTLFPGMPVVTLPDLQSMQVVGFVYDTELRHLAVGVPCAITLDSVPGRSWRGKISSLTSVASRKGFASQHKVFRAVVDVDGIDLQTMKPGMTARIEVAVRLATGVVAVPRPYLTVDAHGRYHVRKGADARTAALHPVRVGTFDERVVEILEGVKAGEKLFLPRAAVEKKS